MSTIFLDRDGVINENRADYVKSWEEFQFLPGACEAIALLTAAGHRIVVCTNQAGIAYGKMSQAVVEDIHRRMCSEIAQTGGKIEAVYYCPHGKDEQCVCRKPCPGLLLRARIELELDLTDALFIGDSLSDMQAGFAASVLPVMVLTGRGTEQVQQKAYVSMPSFPVMESLYQVATSIVDARFEYRRMAMKMDVYRPVLEPVAK
jgi:D-glycero-D-manno-heptose 1,7-bisphosphate phosphatase